MGHQMCDVAKGYVIGMTFTSFSRNSASRTPTNKEGQLRKAHTHAY